MEFRQSPHRRTFVAIGKDAVRAMILEILNSNTRTSERIAGIRAIEAAYTNYTGTNMQDSNTNDLDADQWINHQFYESRLG